MPRIVPRWPFKVLAGIGNDDNRPYCALIDADGAIITTGADVAVDAADVTYTPGTLADWDGSVDPGNQDNANDQLAERVADLEGLAIDELLPVRYEQTFASMYVIQGTSMALTVNASQMLNTFWYFADGNDGDNGTFSCVLKPGSYTIELIGIVGSNKCKLDIDFKHVNDGSYTNIVTQQDWYAGGAAFNTSKTATFTVSTGGRHIFKLAVNGKNASSSNYYIQLSLIMIYLTAGDS